MVRRWAHSPAAVRAVACAAALLGAREALAQCTPLAASGVAHTETFDGLSSAAGTTANALALPGWALAESGASARVNGAYAVDTGASTTGDVYSYGAAGASDRALGTLRASSLAPSIGACFTNATGATLTSFDVAYAGEEWRLGAAGRADTLTFEYSTDASSLTNGSWTPVAALAFSTPETTTAGAQDGNAAAARTALSATVAGLAVADGATFWIRWTDADVTGADDGLAVDDLVLTPHAAALPTLAVDDVAAAEGTASTTSFTFTISLSAPAPAGGVTFDVATADGAARAPGDYAARALTGQTIPAGATTYSFAVAVDGDAAPEANEGFQVVVSNVVGATVADAQGAGTILDDDAPPCVEGVTCAAGDYCAANDLCVARRAQGAACNPALDCKSPGTCAECASGPCVDGVCCDGACAGPCAACSAAKKGAGADGVCGPIAAGNDPDGECDAEAPATCGRSGACDGAGACALHGSSVACGDPVCVGAESRARRCDGHGDCATATSGAACAPYACSSGSGACLTTCAGPSDCAATHYCVVGTATCAPKLDPGAACTGAGECASGFCVDGVCCDAACAGTCEACSAAKKGQGGDGACGAIAAGADPDDECAAESRLSCGRTGVCSGAGACATWPTGTDCASTPGSNVCVGNRAVGRVCTAPGTCADAPGGTECAPQRCVGGACAPCATSGDCAEPTTHFCDGAGACRPKKARGIACASADECTSGNCVDGLCCDSACAGACEWCGDPQRPGLCGPAPSGRPKGARACAAPDGGVIADAGAADGGVGAGVCALACDGQARATCTFASSGTLCAVARCAAHAVVGTSRCDGQGVCVAGAAQDCGLFSCNTTNASCRTTCESDADCQAGAACDLRLGACVEVRDAGADAAPSADAGVDATVGVPEAGASGGRDAALPPPFDAGDAGTDPGIDVQCGCRLSGGAPERGGAALALLLAAAVARRRRRVR